MATALSTGLRKGMRGVYSAQQAGLCLALSGQQHL